MKKITKILHITSVTSANSNGVATAVSNYLDYEGKIVNVAVLNLEDDIDFKGLSYNVSDYKNISSLPDGFDLPDLVIFNEVYKPGYLKLYKECIRRNIPYVIIPHGCLVKKAQDRKKLKKIFGNLLFFNKFIKKSLAVQYLNKNEIENSIVKNHRYVISGNGINIQKKKNKYTNKDFIYIGRYDIDHKGLDLVVKTVLCNKDWFINNKLRIYLYGPKLGDDYKKIEKIIKGSDLFDVIVLNDALYEDKKNERLLNAYVFVQTSRYEGQPMSVMEALSYGLPCIVTYNTSFGYYVNANKCGIGIDFDEDQLFVAIKKLYEDEKFRNICAENTKIIEDDYSWSRVTTECLKQYEALL